ncbi:MAG: hypothetical protein DME98_06675 [Verrucomicrobia bacterium]|jgi:hypothetical protein|nr:MAG: hypothetical protein DME98_06675 [Verrucomicrobiota bacterium]PYJ31155.1 MAG: hypothetical protein DME88_16500 [Verrucomicrobiota bacterium]
MNTVAQPNSRAYLTNDHQLLGAAGTYFVMSELSARGYHASCMFGNAPHVDILVSSSDGARSIAIQVKTTALAKRWTRKRKEVKKLTQLQWYLGRKAAKANLKGLFVVFVDFDKGSASPLTDCYVVPSSFIYEFCKSWIDDSDKNKMVRLHISPAQIEQYRGAWDLIRDALKETEPNQVLQPAAAALGISAATE